MSASSTDVIVNLLFSNNVQVVDDIALASYDLLIQACVLRDFPLESEHDWDRPSRNRVYSTKDLPSCNSVRSCLTLPTTCQTSFPVLSCVLRVPLKIRPIATFSSSFAVDVVAYRVYTEVGLFEGVFACSRCSRVIALGANRSGLPTDTGNKMNSKLATRR